jgi:hypothetical protein
MLKQLTTVAPSLGSAIALVVSLSFSAYSGELRSTKKQATSKAESSTGWNKPNRYKSSRKHARWDIDTITYGDEVNYLRGRARKSFL